MSKGIFITATGTDVGKTYVTALLVKKLRESGFNAGYYKAALSGAEVTQSGLVPGDAAYVNEIAQLQEEPQKLVSYIYENAVSPHLAAQIEGNPVELDVVKSDYEEICRRYDYVVVEGSGGIVCPIRFDETNRIFLEDIIKMLDLDTIIVADAGLGTINAVALTVEYLVERNIKIRGIIFNHFHPENVMEEDNKNMVEEITGVPVIAVVQDNEESLAINQEELAQIFR